MTASVTFPEKTALRRELRARRKAVTAAQRQRADRLLARYARRWLKPARKVAVYVAVGSEAPTDALIKLALRRGCHVYVPQVPRHGRQLRFARVDADTRWRLGRHAIPEPTVHPKQPLLHPRRLDLAFVPLLGFDASLTRMGQGGGYYDASFSFRRYTVRPRLLGLAFACQQVDGLPVEPWDLRVDALITEHGVLRPRRLAAP
ncbi:5-formyltetrahydrofolate cyclo-ligase [Andreprevotia sp. IGB-42]|uniref:5-formyltetrahydrofolate cyclo-ligase n=1 Tax=Andreprevotia sp. IGB-42 TaxID=2497473 RepID=UPI00135B5FCE|nr:5-formyltetrahydrofolate cyclo-ligase [Andreprevotia sp. IGB-42]